VRTTDDPTPSPDAVGAEAGADPLDALLTDVTAAAERLAECQGRVRVARADRDGAIRRSLLAGAPLARVAAAAGITRQAVHLISHPVRRRAQPHRPKPRDELERLSRRTRQAMVLAQEEARSLGQPEVAPEHLLLGLLREGVAIRVHDPEEQPPRPERPATVGIQTIRSRLRAARPHSPAPPPGRLPFTEAASLVLDGALGHAASMDHRRIEPEHVLLALMEDPSTLTASVLSRLGVDAAALRAATTARYPARARRRSSPSD